MVLKYQRLARELQEGGRLSKHFDKTKTKERGFKMIRALLQEEKENIRGGTTLTTEQAKMINNVGKEDSMSEIKQNVASNVAKELKKQEMQYAQTVASPKSNEEDEKNLDEIVNEHELNVSEQYELSDDIEKYKNQLVTLDNHSIMEYGYEAQSNLTKL